VLKDKLEELLILDTLLTLEFWASVDELLLLDRFSVLLEPLLELDRLSVLELEFS
jgi:hypothetical protein